MNRKVLIAGATLALALAALLLLPGSSGVARAETHEPAAEAAPVRGWLGVGLRQLTPELQTHFGAPEGSGVLVASVSDGGPSAAAGIRVGDVITAVDGLAVDSSRELAREVRHRPGESVMIELYRDETPRQVTATLGEREAHAWRGHGRVGRSAEEWEELAERWARWGEEFGERMGRWGEEFGQRWGEEHAESWERWAEEMAERGEGWEEMGEEIGRAIEQALSEIDWEEIGASVEESMKALERNMEELDRQLEERPEATESESE